MTDIPKNSPWGRALEAQSDKQGLWERLFGSRDTGSYDRLICGPGRRDAERGRER